MTKFETGKTYYTRSACNHDCVWVYTIKKRTQKSAVLVGFYGGEIRRKIKEVDGVEFIEVENYSMAPVLHADKVYKEA